MSRPLSSGFVCLPRDGGGSGTNREPQLSWCVTAAEAEGALVEGAVQDVAGGIGVFPLRRVNFRCAPCSHNFQEHAPPQHDLNLAHNMPRGRGGTTSMTRASTRPRQQDKAELAVQLCARKCRTAALAALHIGAMEPLLTSLAAVSTGDLPDVESLSIFLFGAGLGTDCGLAFKLKPLWLRLNCPRLNCPCSCYFPLLHAQQACSQSLALACCRPGPAVRCVLSCTSHAQISLCSYSIKHGAQATCAKYIPCSSHT